MKLAREDGEFEVKIRQVGVALAVAAGLVSVDSVELPFLKLTFTLT